jgi:hypothetical protein
MFIQHQEKVVNVLAIYFLVSHLSMLYHMHWNGSNSVKGFIGFAPGLFHSMVYQMGERTNKTIINVN